MSSYAQQDRQMEIHTPLGDDELLLTGFKGGEEFNKLFHYQLTMLSLNNAIAAKDIIGKNISFSITLRDKSPRYFNGYIARFAFRGSDDRFSSYVAEIVPWTWFLTQTKDCRMFQDKTVPQIIQEVFQDFSVAKFDAAEIRGVHEKWNYCVQYRESDFDFVARLMEQEGIYYYFKHEDGKHTMVLGDTPRGYKDADENSASLKASFASGFAADNLLDWERVYEFRPAKWAHADYNFETPSANMVANASAKSDASDADKFEIFDYPGDYETKTQGEADARLRTEEIASGTDVVHGKSVNASWGPGYKFTVDQHYVASEEGSEYVLTSVTHVANLSGEYRSTGHGELEYTNTFTAIPATKPFRPDRVTPKPIVRGPQTAVVVGPPGETIPVDHYGRVKVSFFWDRRSKKDDTSSCWIRVSQNSGGAGWGGMFHPHTGHEVIVSFIEGDPDRPIITGRVYNAERDHPMDPVALKSRSGYRDHGGNKMVMEGADGAQILHLHCPTHESNILMGHSVFMASTSNLISEFQGNEQKKIAGCSFTGVSQGMDIRVGTGNPVYVSDEGGIEAQSKRVSNESKPNGLAMTVSTGDMKVEVSKGNHFFEVNTGSSKMDIKKNWTIKIDGNKKETIEGKEERTIKKDSKTEIEGNKIGIFETKSNEKTLSAKYELAAGMSAAFSLSAKHETTIGVSIGASLAKKMELTKGTVLVIGKAKETRLIKGELGWKAEKDLDMKSTTEINLEAPEIELKGTEKITFHTPEVELKTDSLTCTGKLKVKDSALTVS